MEKHFATYEQSLALKVLGFDEPCLANYNNLTDKTRFIFGKTNEGCITANKVPGTDTIVISNERILAPLKSQVFEWFRKEHKLRSNVMDFIDDITGIEWDYEIATIGTDLDESGNYIPLVDYSIDDETRKFKTYEEAESSCIDKLIELVKKK